MIASQTDSLLKLYEEHFLIGQEDFEKKNYFHATLSFARSLTISELIDDPRLTIQAKLYIADVQFTSKSYRNAYNLYKELIEYTQFLSQEDHFHVMNRIGVINCRIGRYSEAKNIFEKLLQYDNPGAKRRAYINMGVMYYYLDTFFEEDCMDKAIQSFTHALEYCKDDDLMKHKILRNTGMAFYEMGDYTSALAKLKDSLLLTDDKIELAQTLNELAKVHIELHDFEQASKNLREAEKILLNYHNLEELSRNIFIHGLLSRKKGRVESAFSQFRTALQGFVEAELYPEAVLVCREIYLTFRDSKKERADFYLDQYQFYLNYLDPMEL